jgi:hypothetical protein
MIFGSSLRRLPALAALVLAALAVLPAGAALAQAKAPVVSSTLDVCQDDATGNWRYSGVVSLLPSGDAATAMAVDYFVQNGTLRDGFNSVLKAGQGAGVTVRSGQAQVMTFSVDAPPLTLGSVRNAVTVTPLTLAGAGTPIYAVGEELTAQVCGCGPKGCVRTQGYWGNKPGVVWPGGWYRAMNFYSAGMSWQQLLDTPPRGNAYVILAVQFISAVLNRNAGASAPQGVQDVMAAARNWFASGTTLGTCSPGTCGLQKTWAATLDVYNNGNYPGAPKHCGD